MSASGGYELFTVPAGTVIDRDAAGHWVFYEPGALPYWITIAGGWPPHVIKTSISTDCKVPEIQVGVSTEVGSANGL